MKPPPLADLTLRLLVRREAAQAMIGDLREEFARFKVADLGPFRARVWYWQQTLSIILRFGPPRIPELRRVLLRWRRGPDAVAVSGITLALGLTAVAAVFTYIRSLSQPMPGVRGEGLLEVYRSTEDTPFGSLSYRDAQDLASQDYGAIQGAAAEQGGFAASVRHADFTEVIFGQAVSGGYFSLLGVRMAAGRGLTPDDDNPAAPPAVVLSYRYWSSRFARDPQAVGSTILLNNNPYTIVGVAGPDFLGTDSGLRPDVWMPLEQFGVVYWARSDAATNRNRPGIQMYVRLREGSGEERAGVELAAVARGLDETAPLDAGSRTLIVKPAAWVHPAMREAESSATRLMFLAGIGLLALAGANLANLLLAAVTGRTRELGVRAALGASRGRLLGHLLLDHGALSLGAACVALLLADPLASRIGWYFGQPTIWGANVPREASVDLDVVLVTVAAALLAGTLAAVVPAIRLGRGNLVEALKHQGAGGQAAWGRERSPRRIDLRDVSVAGQMTLAVLLVTFAGLVLATLRSVEEIDPGFDADHIMASYLSTSSSGVVVQDRQAFFRDLALRFEEEPWVRSATVAAQAPLSPHPRQEVRLEGHDDPVTLTYASVTPGFFETTGMGVSEGRAFLPGDTAGAPDVAIVNETLARRFFSDVGAVGRTVSARGQGEEPGRAYEIVGVVKDARVTNLLGEPEPVLFLAYPQHYYTPGNALLLQTSIDPAQAVPRFLETLKSIDPTLALVNAVPYRDVVRGFQFIQRRNAEVFSLVAFLGLALAAAGLYGVLSLSVGERRREIGVRVALGAEAWQVVRGVLVRPVGAIATGALVGLLLSAAAAPLIRTLLIGVGPHDPGVALVGICVLFVVAAVASLLPLRRALRVDPMVALRSE